MKTIRVCAEAFSAEMIERIKQTIANEPGLTRRQLSTMVCEWLDWRDARQRLKTMSCRVALLRLHRRGLIELPRVVHSFGPRAFQAVLLPSVPHLECGVRELSGLRLERVSAAQPQQSALWNELVARYHYLGQQPLAGAQLRYLICCDQGPLGAISFSAAAWRVEARDRYIGWPEEQREAHLRYVVNNSRFLILPTVRVRHLASKVLGMCARQLPRDWRVLYGYEPVMLETFVEWDRFRGTCYQAAGWVCVGRTKGRGKMDRQHRAKVPVKAIYLKPLVKDWRERLGGEAGHWAPVEAKDWAEEEFDTVEMGDERLKQRLLRLTRDFYARPEANIPQACGSYAKIKAAYRFFGHRRVTMRGMLKAHQQATVQRIRGAPVVLAVQDTVVLNYTGHRASEDLGDIGTQAGRTKGLIVHDTMAFDPQGTALGLLDVQSWVRCVKDYGKKHGRKQKPIEEKESVKWLRSFQAVSQVQERLPGTVLVSVGDREADIYELFEQAAQVGEAGPKLLIRASYNQALKEEQSLLWDCMQQAPMAGCLEVDVPRKPGQKKRRAVLAISFVPVELKAPKGKSGSVGLWAVYAREKHPPPGVQALSWMLLTTVPVADFEQAVEKVRWYMVRWQIEVYHKVLKSGCRIEDHQLQTRKELEACLGVDMVVGWRIIYLTRQSRQRPDEPCSVHFQEHEWKALLWYTKGTVPTDAHEPTLRTITHMIAKLGGFIGRKCDGEPGCQTLWRGWQRFEDIVACYLLSTRHQGNFPYCVQPAYGAG